MSKALSWRSMHVAVAALAMVLTLPGRTQGLGIFTDPLLNSLELDRESYAFMNLWATLLGAFLCLPCGWLLDRLGTRIVFVTVTAALGTSVLAMSAWTTGQPSYVLHLNLPKWMGGSMTWLVMLDLFVFLTLTRGLGQSALSVVSLGLVGRSVPKRSGIAMGAYAFFTSLGFMGAFVLLGKVVKSQPDEWRLAWAGIGWAVLVGGVLAGLLLIRNPYLDADPSSNEAAHDTTALPEPSKTFAQALRSPAFWTFSISSSFYLLISSGITLNQQSILAERGFDNDVFSVVIWVGIPYGLGSNLLCGWLATRWSLACIQAWSLCLLAVTLAAYPLVQSDTQVYAYACSLAVVGGGITVCFFAAWRRGFGPAHLGKIQGLAQMLTVLFSALGPLLFASVQARLHSYLPLFYCLAGCSLALAFVTWIVGIPTPRQETST